MLDRRWECRFWRMASFYGHPQSHKSLAAAPHHFSFQILLDQSRRARENIRCPGWSRRPMRLFHSRKRSVKVTHWRSFEPVLWRSKPEVDFDRAGFVGRELEGRRRLGGGHGGGQERSDLRAVARDVIDRQMKFVIEAEGAHHVDLLGHDR